MISASPAATSHSAVKGYANVTTERFNGTAIGEQIANMIASSCHGSASRSRKSGDVERERSEGIKAQPRTLNFKCGARLLRTGASGLPAYLHAASEPAADADSGAGMEAIAEVALNMLKASTSMCSLLPHFAHRRTAVLNSNQHLFSTDWQLAYAARRWRNG